jgi:predicted  nucleic acid-binding Zn-ribbon protein
MSEELWRDATGEHIPAVPYNDLLKEISRLKEENSLLRSARNSMAASFEAMNDELDTLRKAVLAYQAACPDCEGRVEELHDLAKGE